MFWTNAKLDMHASLFRLKAQTMKASIPQKFPKHQGPHNAPASASIVPSTSPLEICCRRTAASSTISAGAMQTSSSECASDVRFKLVTQVPKCTVRQTPLKMLQRRSGGERARFLSSLFMLRHWAAAPMSNMRDVSWRRQAARVMGGTSGSF